MSDYFVRRVQDVLRRPIVLLQSDHLRTGIFLFKVENIAYVCSPELIDGLVIVTDYTEVAVPRGQKLHKKELNGIGILVLVDHDVPEFFLIIGQDIRLPAEQLDGQYQKIIKIQRVVLLQPLLVGIIASRILLFDPSGRIFLIFFRSDHLVFCRGNLTKNRLLLIDLRIQLQQADYLLHDLSAVIRVIDGEVILVADKIDVSPQNPAAGRMKGGNPDALGSGRHQLIDALPHLSRRLVREGDRHDIPRTHLSLGNEVCDPTGQRPCFSGACARQNQKRPFRRCDRLPLRGV